MDLHTHYRPTDFEGLLGQESVVKSVKQALTKKICRAFLFTGPAGVGKTSLARIVAAHVKCPPRQVTEVDAASRTGVDDMRAVMEPLGYAGLDGGPRVLIIDEAHMLSKSAWNSLLKTTEEPPAGVYIILCTTEPDRIPKTIRTRFAFYQLKPVAKDLIYGLLKTVRRAEKMTETPNGVLRLISDKSQGSVRQALVHLGQCAECGNRATAAELIKAVESEDELINFVRTLVSKGKGMRWVEAVRLLKPHVDVNPESIRYTVVSYLTAVLLATKEDTRAGAMLEVLDAFADPYPSGATTLAPVLLSVGRVLLS